MDRKGRIDKDDDFGEKLEYYWKHTNELKQKMKDLERMSMLLEEKRKKRKEPSEQLKKLYKRTEEDLGRAREMDNKIFGKTGPEPCKLCGRFLRIEDDINNHYLKEHKEELDAIIMNELSKSSEDDEEDSETEVIEIGKYWEREDFEKKKKDFERKKEKDIEKAKKEHEKKEEKEFVNQRQHGKAMRNPVTTVISCSVETGDLKAQIKSDQELKTSTVLTARNDLE